MSKRPYPHYYHWLHGTDVLAGESSAEAASPVEAPAEPAEQPASQDVLGYSATAAEPPAAAASPAVGGAAVPSTAVGAAAVALQPFSADDALAPAQASLAAAPAAPVLRSEIAGVSDEKWTEFAKQMRTSTQPGQISASNGLGMWDMRPRRLADLGLVKNLASMRGPAGGKNGRMVWTGEWIAPMTSEKFLSDSRVQYRAFAESMKRYVAGLRDGSIPRPEGGVPSGISLSGILAILHRAGPSGLKNWGDPESRFEATKQIFERVNGIF